MDYTTEKETYTDTSLADDSKFLETSSGTSTWVIIVFSIFIIIVFWIFILFIIKTNPNTTTTTIVQCAPGQCGTNIFTGNKTCPSTPASQVTISPGLSLCNSPYICENPLTPYALQKDGSTDANGVCPLDSDPCNCLTVPQCGSYIPTAFSSANGDPNISIQNQRIYFNQTTASTTSGNQFLNSPPLSVNNVSQFCSIPPYWANRTWPSILDDNNKLSGCIQGAAAFTPSDINNFGISNVNSTPIACVNGTPCVDRTATPIWDRSNQVLVCKNICGTKSLIWDSNNNQFNCG